VIQEAKVHHTPRDTSETEVWYGSDFIFQFCLHENVVFSLELAEVTSVWKQNVRWIYAIKEIG
jgi:hypothetical protein